MKILLNIQAINTGYRINGTGRYVSHLEDGLKNTKDNNEYIFYDGKKSAPKSDIYHIPHFSPYIKTLPINKPTGRLVLTLHDLIPVMFHEFFPPGYKGSFNWYLQKYLIKNKVDHIITNSETTKEDVIDHIDYPEEKITVTHLAADKIYRPIKTDRRKLRNELRNKFNIPEKFALYVGDILWSKNVPGLIESVQKINATLVIVGKQAVDKNIDLTHPWNKDIVKVQRQAEKDKRIITLGYVKNQDLVKLYNMASVYCQPSHYEGFGVPVVEAMASGCPVVISGEGALSEVAGEAGFYVDAGDTRSIADGIGEIYFNANKYKEHSSKALEQAKKFSWDKTIKQTIEVYNTLNGY